MLKKFEARKKSGFTLAELLIVVAIIAVLVAIAIPIFNAQLEKSRRATDLANLRAAYAEASADALEKGGAGEATSENMQSDGKFESGTKIGGVDVSEADAIASFTKGKAVEVSIAADGTVTFTGNK